MKKKIIALIAIVIVILGIIIFIISNNTLKVDDVIGTWEINSYTQGDINNYYMPSIEFYKGGTAKGKVKDSNTAFIPLTYEIKDNVLVITQYGYSTSYSVNDNMMTSADETVTFKKVK